MPTATQTAASNGTTVADADDTPGLTPLEAARMLDLEGFKPNFGEMVDIENAIGGAPMFRTSPEGLASSTAAGMLGMAWAALRRVLPDITLADVRELSMEDFGASLPKAKVDAGQAQG